MKKCVLIHPRRLTRVMREFIQEVVNRSDAVATIWVESDDNENWMGLSEVEVIPNVTIHHVKGYNNFCAHCDYYEFEEEGFSADWKFRYDIQMLLSSTSRDYNTYSVAQVMADECHRNPSMKGFSQVVRILLHEIGHYMVTPELLDKYTAEELYQKRKESRISQRSINNYPRLPDEFAATNWGINWLMDKENRKLAREFEKKFWSCFA